MTTTVQSRPIAPRVNVYEDADSYIIQAEMPGVDREHTHIEVHDGALTLRGTRTVANGSSTLHVRERPRGEFHRRFSLGKGVDLQNVQARMNNGLLTITLPKTKRLQPQIININ